MKDARTRRWALAALAKAGAALPASAFTSSAIDDAGGDPTAREGLAGVRNGALFLKEQGIVADAATEQTALQDAINSAVGTVGYFEPLRTVVGKAEISIGDDDLVLDFERGKLRSPNGAYVSDVLRFVGTMSPLVSVTLDTTSQPGFTLVTWASGIPAGVVTDRWIKVVADDLLPRYGTTFSLRAGMALKVISVSGNTATCMGELPYASYYTTNVRASVFPRGRVIVRGGSVEGDVGQPADPLPGNHHLMFKNLVMPEARSIRVSGGPAPGIIFWNCVNAKALDCLGDGLEDRLGVAVGSLNSLNTYVEGLVSSRSRHLLDSSANSVPTANSADPTNYGLDWYFVTNGGRSQGATTSALTTHEGAFQPVTRGAYVTDADKVIGARGDCPQWHGVHAVNCAAGVQVVRTTNSMEVRDSVFNNLRGQVWVNNQVSGVDQDCVGTTIVNNCSFSFRSVGQSSVFVPVIGAGALMRVEQTDFIYLGNENGKSIIRPYGTGSLHLDVTIDLRRVSGVTSIVPVRLSSALTRVTGKVRVLLVNAAAASMVSTIVQVDNGGPSYVDLDVDFVTDDGSIVVDPPFINLGTNTDGLFFRSSSADSANNFLSIWGRRTNISQASATATPKLVHNSKDDCFRFEIFPTENVTGLQIAPGYRRGQRCLIRNSNSGGFSAEINGAVVNGGGEREFIWTGSTWDAARVIPRGSRSWTPGTGSVAAGAVVVTDVTVSGAVVGEPATVRFQAATALPVDLVITARATAANNVRVYAWNPTAGVISTTSQTVICEVVR